MLESREIRAIRVVDHSSGETVGDTSKDSEALWMVAFGLVHKVQERDLTRWPVVEVPGSGNGRG